MDNTKKSKGKFDWLKTAHQYYQLGQYHNVIRACNQALQFDRVFDRAHLGRALAFYKLQRTEIALLAIKQTIDCNPQNIKAYILKGDIYCEQRKYKDAIVAYNQALQIDPNNKAAQQGKEQARVHQSESDKKNGELFYDIAEKKEETEESYFPFLDEHIRNGDKFYEEGKYKEALEAYIQALQIDPDNRNALKGKARTHTKLEQYKEAKETYDILQGARTIGKLYPYSWGFAENNQPDFFKW